MKPILDANGRPFFGSSTEAKIERATAEIERSLNEATYGCSAEDRVRELRRSVLGVADPKPALEGLAAWLK